MKHISKYTANTLRNAMLNSLNVGNGRFFNAFTIPKNIENCEEV
jgi:hypothetical protein